MASNYLKPFAGFFSFLNRPLTGFFIFLISASAYFVLSLSTMFYPLSIIFLSSVGAGFISVLVFRAVVIFFLVIYDLTILSSPMQKFVLDYSIEKAKARLLRVFLERSIEYFELDKYALGPLERDFLFLIKKYFRLSFPLLIFSKNPFVLVRIYQRKASTIVCVLCEDAMDGRTLLKFIEQALVKS